MSEATPIDTTSKTALFKQWLKVFVAKDVAKWKGSMTSITNIVSTAAMIWYVLTPIIANNATASSHAEMVQLKSDLQIATDKAQLAADRATAEENRAKENALANKALTDENAKLALRIDELQDAGATPQEMAPPPAKQEAALAPQPPKVKRVKTKAIQAPKEEPTTCQQIEACKAVVAWFEQNVSAGAN